jgi:hypothetical protein
MTNVTIRHIYIDGPSNLDAFPYPDALSKRERICIDEVKQIGLVVTFAEPEQEHFLVIEYANSNLTPIYLTVITECIRMDGTIEHIIMSEYCSEITAIGRLRIPLGSKVTRVNQMKFVVETKPQSTQNEPVDNGSLCQALERLEKNHGMDTRFVLIAYREGSVPYVVHSPMGPLDVLELLNRTQANVIRDTARLIGDE